ncbi:luciferase family protein [uncultured Tateyamaria sp.]|uniref:luciferase domain-containing protein n=1 Tax=uncultured Tateyamaria sp. TaxID=455651 RepID=UPI00262A49D5|nr:luciferase family protein [uncultured Tateyamaria sp.]
MSRRLLEAVSAFEGIKLEETRIGFPGSIGFNLDRTVPLANPASIVVGREIAHMHPDGSLHAALDPALAERAIALGWAESHPWANRRPGWEGFVMIFVPTNQDELNVVIALLKDSYRYITGVSPGA